ncbi:YdcF family protein [Afifella sp. IM 167]|uniref:YdcF family protein n=1 Tax=Afifella sp. IM 167 TaxID=2033586 RepID=UPI001CCADA9A|nr:YdcF family protein [Afifella sp. IM 167]MBZ8134434.1 hypothetical protein [Afifella sp. IM 167]
MTDMFGSWLAAAGGLGPLLATGFAAQLVAALAATAILASPAILGVPEGPISGADALVILGGDGPARADKAIDLWRAGAAHAVLVSGDGDCRSIRQALVTAGLPSRAITLECRSGSTWENAAFSAPFLQAMGARKALLVTSWFHERRALARFRREAPCIAWRAASTPPPTSILELLTGPYAIPVLKEYPKVLAYAARDWWQTTFAAAPTPAPACQLQGARR